MSKVEITIEFDTTNLSRYEDSYLATLWHVSQANPADGHENTPPGEIAEQIGREIIRRWLANAPVELYHHQGRHYWSHQLTKFAQYTAGGAPGTPEWHNGHWQPRTTEPEGR